MRINVIALLVVCYGNCFAAYYFVHTPVRFDDVDAAVAPHVVPMDNLFEFIFGIRQDQFLAAMPLPAEGLKDPLLMLSADHVFDVRIRRFFLITSTGTYACGRCELLTNAELVALIRLRFERFESVRGGLSARTGRFNVVEAIGIDETSPFWHRIDTASLMACERNNRSVFQVFEHVDGVINGDSSCVATLPSCMYRRYLYEGRPTSRSILYQHGVQVVYGQVMDGGGRVCEREREQVIDLAVFQAIDPDQENLANVVAATYQAVINAAFIKEKHKLFCVVPSGVDPVLVADALCSLEPLIKDSNVDLTLVWHSNDLDENAEARDHLVKLVDHTDGSYDQYRTDGMYRLQYDHSTPASPATPMSPATRDWCRRHHSSSEWVE